MNAPNQKYPPLADREAPDLDTPGEVGLDVEMPASDKKGVVGSFIEISRGDEEVGDGSSLLVSFSNRPARIGDGRYLSEPGSSQR